MGFLGYSPASLPRLASLTCFAVRISHLFFKETCIVSQDISYVFQGSWRRYSKCYQKRSANE